MDSFERQAAEIKAEPEKYRELERLRCDCSPRRSTIAVLYAGPDGRMWLWTPGGRGPLNYLDQPNDGPITPGHFLPRAVPLPRGPGEATGAAVATCPRCHKGRLLIPGVGSINQVQLGAPTWGRVTE